MNTDIEFIKKIESYLDGTMSSNELALFKEELEKDKNLQKEVEIHQNIKKAFIKKGKTDLKNELENYYKQYEQRIQKSKVIRMLWPAISVAATILIVLFIYLGMQNKNLPTDKVLTLDTAQINKAPAYADSSVYEVIETNDTIIK